MGYLGRELKEYGMFKNPTRHYTFFLFLYCEELRWDPQPVPLLSGCCLTEHESVLGLIAFLNLVPRSHSVTGNARSGKVRFRAYSVPARPEIRAFLSLRMFVLSVVILGDFSE